MAATHRSRPFIKKGVKTINLSSYNYSSFNCKDKVLIDLDKKGNPINWNEKKLKTLDLAESYKRLGKQFESKHYRVKDCGTYLEYKRISEDNSLKLNLANFCKVRLCPMCSWRRSLKIFGQVSKVMDHIEENQEYEYLFLTLTTRNCEGGDLKDSINNIFNGFNRMTRRKIFKDSIKGFFRALEVTHNLNRYSDFFDTYHPHIHVILVVNKSYFTDKRLYINQKKWTSLWKDVLGIDYNPIVDIRKFKDVKGQGVSKGIAEVAKYTLKDNDYIVKDDITKEIIESMTDEAVFILDQALANRRLTSFGGILKEIHQEFNLDDAEDGDLINTDNDELRDDLEYILERYSWNIGYRQYLKID